MSYDDYYLFFSWNYKINQILYGKNGQIEFSSVSYLLCYVKLIIIISRFYTVIKILNTRNIRGISDFIVSCCLETYSASGDVQSIEKNIQYVKGIIDNVFLDCLTYKNEFNNLNEVFFSKKNKSDFALR